MHDIDEAHAEQEARAIRVAPRRGVPVTSEDLVDSVPEWVRKQRDRDTVQPQFALGACEAPWVTANG